MFKTVKLLFFLVAAALILSACSVISSLLPDQEIDGLVSSEELDMPKTALLTEAPKAPEGLSGQATSNLNAQGLEPYALDSTFFMPFGFYLGVDDLKEPFNATPKKITQRTSFTHVGFIGGTETTVWADELNLTLVHYYMYLIDGYVAPNQVGYPTEWSNLNDVVNLVYYNPYTATLTSNQTLKFKKDDSCQPTSCVYNLDLSSSDPVELALDSNQVTQAMDIISQGGTDSEKNSWLGFGHFRLNSNPATDTATGSTPETLQAGFLVKFDPAVLSFKE